MKNILLALIILSATAFSGFAQRSSYNIGVDIAAPTGAASADYNFATGVAIKYEIPVTPYLFATISGGYEAFFTKKVFTDLGFNARYSFIPLKAGLKYYFGEGGLFIQGEAGFSIATDSGGGRAFAYAPGVGYNFEKGLELSARYEGWNNGGDTIGQFALRISYRFKQ